MQGNGLRAWMESLTHSIQDGKRPVLDSLEVRLLNRKAIESPLRNIVSRRDANFVFPAVCGCLRGCGGGGGSIMVADLVDGATLDRNRWHD